MSRSFISLALWLCAGACQAIEVGQAAPPLSAKLTDGSVFKLSEHRGKVVVIDFWACWCAPCLQELAALKTLEETHRDAGLTVIAINTDDAEDQPKARKIAKAYPFFKALAGDTRAEGYGRIWRLPITFVVDRKGIVREDGGSGPRHAYDLPTLERIVGPLLAEPR